MVTWAVTGQGTEGSTNQIFGASDRIWLNGVNFGDNVTVGAYQDPVHRSNNADAHQCTSAHIHNTKFLTSMTFSLDGGDSISLSSGTPARAPKPCGGPRPS